MKDCDKDCMRCAFDKDGVCVKPKDDIVVKLLKHPTDEDWMEVKRRALVTVGKEAVTPPTVQWKKSILKARHSPIRYLTFSFYLEVPYWVSVHLVRHVHAQPYVKTQRNDRQNEYDRTKAPQDQIVCMIWDMNAEEFIMVMNKRLCNQAADKTREVAMKMKALVAAECPEFIDEMVAMCIRNHACYEMFPCGKPLKTEV